MGYYDFSDAEMKAYASNVFIKLLIGVMKKDLSHVKHFLGTELYEEINKKVEGLKEKNLTQIYEEPNISECIIVNKTEYEDKYTVKIKLRTKIIDYIINEKEKVISGFKKIKTGNVYYLVFEIIKQYQDYNLTPKCPNCDASISVNESGKCEHCGSIFPLEKYDWILKSIR